MIKKMKYLSLLVLLGLILAALTTPAAASAINGSNLWDQDQRMPATYTWTPAIYSGFWYDFDRGIHTENITLRISASDRQINAEGAEYNTEVRAMRFAYSDWGSYRVIAWQGEPYFAGYTRASSGNNSTVQFANSNVSTLSDGKIYQVLRDTNTEISLNAGGRHTLENGYSLTVSDVNESNRSFRLTLERNGNSVKSEIVSNNTTFVYERSLDGVGTVPIIAVHVKGLDGTRAVMDGVFQISESSTDVRVGRSIGAMEITNVSDTRITMRNPSRINLNRNSTVTLMNHIRIDVKDTSALKFELISDPKTDMERQYPNRGMVYSSANTNRTWNGMNFPGFTYDYNNRTETENLTFDVSGTLQRSISAKQIMYSTNVYNESFNFSGWGSYQAINLGGENYFAGYLRFNSSDRNNTTNFTDSNDSLLRNGTVSKVLINNGTERQYNVGANITLEEGYTLHISNITNNGTRANLILRRDGNTVREASVSSGENFVYEVNVGGTVVPVVAVHVANVFEGSSSVVRIGGVFQISSNATDVGIGTRIGNMSVEFTSNTALIFANTNAINLTRGSNITLMDSLALHVADSDELRFFPFTQNAGNTSSSLRIEVPDTIHPNEEIRIVVSHLDNGNWRELAGAAVRVNNIMIGQTNSSGAISYTIGGPGTYEFRAERSGYTPATLTRSTAAAGDQLQIVIPDFIFAEDSFRLYVTDSNNTNISGVGVFKNNVHIGTTNDNGMINVTANSEPGIYNLTASRTGYTTGTKEMRILEYGPYFAVTNIDLPENATTGRNVKIVMTVENVGKERDTQDVIITVENKTETKRITLSPGDSRNQTFTFRPETAGDILIEAANQTFTLTVAERQKTDIPWGWVLVSAGFLIIIVGTVIALMYYKERKEEEKKNPKRSVSGKKTKSKGFLGGIFGNESDKKMKKTAERKKTKTASSSASNTASKSPSSSKQAASPPKQTAQQTAVASKPNSSNKYSSSSKAPELKNSQKKARSEQEKKK